MTLDHSKIKRIFWEDIRKNFIKVNPTLGKIIDECNPDRKLPLYTVEYDYGSSITDNGILQLPSDAGGTLSIEDISIAAEIQDELTYNLRGLPLGIPLEGGAELFIPVRERPLPWTVFSPGKMFALWRKLDPKLSYHPSRIFCMTAGARTVIMGANINDANRHHFLKQKFRIRHPATSDIARHWNIFKEIINDPSSNCKWNTKLLFFTKPWLDAILSDDGNWAKLHLYLVSNTWANSSYDRNQHLYDFIFSSAQQQRNLKPNPYIADTAKHLLSLIAGASPGMSIANDDTLLPASFLRMVYAEVYKTKDLPLLLIPNFYNIKSKSTVYYSLQYPTTFEFSPRSRKDATLTYDLSELKHIMDIFIDEIKQGTLPINETLIADLLSKTNFKYFHLKQNDDEGIQGSSEIPQHDPAILTFAQDNPELKFADRTTFFRGCVSLTGE